jgi:hypothetical protein
MATALPKVKRTAVIAGNFREFVSWCQEHAIRPSDRTVIYVRDVHSLRGRLLTELTVERYGTWYDRGDLAELDAVLRYMNARDAATPVPGPMAADVVFRSLALLAATLGLVALAACSAPGSPAHCATPAAYGLSYGNAARARICGSRTAGDAHRTDSLPSQNAAALRRHVPLNDPRDRDTSSHNLTVSETHPRALPRPQRSAQAR